MVSPENDCQKATHAVTQNVVRFATAGKAQLPWLGITTSNSTAQSSRGITISNPSGGRSCCRNPIFLAAHSMIGTQNGIQTTSLRYDSSSGVLRWQYSRSRLIQ